MLLWSCSGVYMYGSQPLAYFAVRSMAGSLRPATQIGGCGFCVGAGSIETSLSVEYLPLNVTFFSVHNLVITSSASLVRDPRCLTGTPHASNSLGNSPPIPTPKL